ncbi:MAG TPA: hypothetical protein VFN38_05385 [Gemmatimonadaceae bacterium]|nr:hypothetical protein [Gemmatimonadaceae bacterium]
MQRPLPPLALALRLALLILLALFLGVVGAHAQLVTPKTVPVLQDAQFDVAPSSRPGLGSSFLALEDSLSDPFSNPAKATRLRGVSVAMAPYTHSISGQRGGGSTLPAALYANLGPWAGAILVTYQNIDRAGPAFNRPVSERTANTQYVSGLLARRIGGVSVGAAASHAGLEAVDGVDLLYGGSDRIDQRGSVNDFRLGITREWAPGHAAELLGIHSRTDMTHDVHFTTWTWDPVLRTTIVAERQERNLDQTNIWGIHSKYYRPVGTAGWRVGGLVTANRLSHPKIPNYVLQNIPRDPGTTYGYDLGVGAARIAGGSSFFVDLIVEPMRSETWADLARDTTDVGGTVIPAGARTMENSFDFHNSKARVGAGHAFPVNADSSNTLAFDVGLSLYTIGYGLRQTNNVARTTRRQAERWTELSQSLGVRFRSRGFELSYAFRRVCGNQGCDDTGPGILVVPGVALESARGIIAAPSAPLFIQGGNETTHRFSVGVAVR